MPNFDDFIICGFRMGERENEVKYDSWQRHLIAHEQDFRNIVKLRPTMARLLESVLSQQQAGYLVEDAMLLSEVWEDRGLKGSGQRLWQVMSGLQHKLSKVGLPEQFITRVYGKGYIVHPEMVLPVYCRLSDLQKRRKEINQYKDFL